MKYWRVYDFIEAYKGLDEITCWLTIDDLELVLNYGEAGKEQVLIKNKLHIPWREAFEISWNNLKDLCSACTIYDIDALQSAADTIEYVDKPIGSDMWQTMLKPGVKEFQFSTLTSMENMEIFQETTYVKLPWNDGMCLIPIDQKIVECILRNLNTIITLSDELVNERSNSVPHSLVELEDYYKRVTQGK